MASKYKAKPVMIDGIRFASQKEGARYCILKLLERTGKIRDLKLQPNYRLEVRGKLICRYRADFEYIEIATKCLVVEDAKGFKTPTYKLKKALFEAIYGKEILET